MANQGGTPENLKPPWKAGESGNPAGYSASRRVTSALVKMIEKHKGDDLLAQTWFAAAIGDPKLLNGRKPNFQFFKELLDRIEGKVPDKLVTHEGAEPLTDPEEAAIAIVYGKQLSGDGADGG